MSASAEYISAKSAYCADVAVPLNTPLASVIPLGLNVVCVALSTVTTTEPVPGLNCYTAVALGILFCVRPDNSPSTYAFVAASVFAVGVAKLVKRCEFASKIPPSVKV